MVFRVGLCHPNTQNVYETFDKRKNTQADIHADVFQFSKKQGTSQLSVWRIYSMENHLVFVLYKITTYEFNY